VVEVGARVHGFKVGDRVFAMGVVTRGATSAELAAVNEAAVARAGNGWVFSVTHGGWEYPVYLTVLPIAQILLGEGALALSRREPETARAAHYA
jgi:putative oxidoreductase